MQALKFQREIQMRIGHIAGVLLVEEGCPLHWVGHTEASLCDGGD